MSIPPKYTMTNESISIFSGGKMHTIQKGTGNFVALRTAIINEDWDAIPRNLTVEKAVKDWVKGKFTLDGDQVSFEGNVLPRDFTKRLNDMAARGESTEPLVKFWEKLQKNPSYRSVHQLWPFLNQRGIPFTKTGNFLAYKAVKSDFKDVHSGTFDNSPGRTNEMPRNQISDDPEVPCHEGFHVGALEYARSFHSGGHIVVCEVDPADVVCVPKDSSQQKMRVCKYKVIGRHNGEFMEDTTHDDPNDAEAEDFPEPEIEEDSFPEPAEEEGKAPKEKVPRVKKTPTILPRKSHPKLDAMGLQGLMEESLDVLRKYAGKNLLITGASKIPGGKAALVAAIMKIRK